MSVLFDEPIFDNETVFDLAGATWDLLEDHGTYSRSLLLSAVLYDYDYHVLAWIEDCNSGRLCGATGALIEYCPCGRHE